jgi:class 3 adenylate cyclase/DNA-binding CsgD family transcriptional regulator
MVGHPCSDLTARSASNGGTVPPGMAQERLGRATCAVVEPSTGSGPGVVVVLFTDVVGSTQLLGRLGDDAAEELRREHFSLLRQIVAGTGGREVKSLGDGLMVAFTSPLDALRCAVTMQERVADRNQDAAHPLEIRIGLHAGEPLSDGSDIHGTSVVLARRLCDRAAGGQILTSQLVADLVGSRGGFRFLRLGRTALKGVSEPVSTVAVQWEPASRPEPGAGPSGGDRHPARGKAPRSRGPQFVGRQDERGVLQAEFARVQADEMRCVLLLGDPGVGKSRLMAEFVADAHQHAVVLSARAYPLGATASFGLWAEALEGHLRSLAPEDVAAVCGGFLDDLAGLLRSVATVRGAIPEREPSRLRMMEALAVALSNLTRQEPVVVVADDMHLADSSSWEALQYLAHNLADARLLVVAAARPVELSEHPNGPQVVFSLEQEGVLRRLAVGVLDAGGLGELAAAMTGCPATPVLIDWLAERSRGNALYAVGLLHALIDEGADLKAPALRRIPEALADRVSERLKLLDEPTRSTLEILAVLGRRIGIAELGEVTSRPRDRLDELLDGLLRLRLILEEERGRELTYEIAHPLIQEVIYEGIRRSRRRALHRTAGRCLLDAGLPGEAAPHFVRCADPGDDEAIQALTEALRQAEEREADREALEILAGLVEVLPAGDARWADVAAAVSWYSDWVVDHRGDNLALGIGAMREINAVLANSGDLTARAAARLGLASFLGWGTGETAEAEQLAREALALFERTDDESRALLARNEVAWIAGLKGDARTMEVEARTVVERAGQRGHRFALMQGLTTLGNALMFEGDFAEADKALSASLAIATEDGKLYEQMRVLAVMGMSRGYEGRIAAALEAIEQAKRVNPAVPPTWEPLVLWIKGDFPSVLRTVETAIAWKPIGTSRRRGVLLALGALSASETGDFPQAHQYAEAAAAIYTGDFMYFAAYSAYAGAVLSWREGRIAEAAATLAALSARVPVWALGPFHAPILLDLAEVSAASGAVDTAVQAAASLESFAQAFDRDLYRGFAALAATHAGLMGGTADIVSLARQAGTTFSELGYPVFAGRARLVLGRALGRTDRSAAIDVLEEAAATFQGSGALWWRDQALDTLRSLRGRAQRVAGGVLGPASLTPREREVATLASQGLTARQIAEQLYIGERTVEGHLASVYAKLGIRSKVELVRRAADFTG